MTAYRRNFIPRLLFFTVNLADRRLRLLTEHVDALRYAFRETRERHPFRIEAVVILPDHLHVVWTMPEGDRDFATRWRLINSTFSRGFATGEPVSAAASPKANAAFGSGAIGSIPFAMRTIWRVTSITSISIQ